jgi:hypothetical protein
MMMSGPAPLWIAAVTRGWMIVLVDALDRDLDAGLLAELLGLGLEEGDGPDAARGGNEVRTAASRCRRRALRVGRRPLGRRGCPSMALPAGGEAGGAADRARK